MAGNRIPDVGTIVTAQEVSDLLNSYGGETSGANGDTLFSIAANINPFSKRKPIADSEGVKNYPERKFYIPTADMAKQYNSGGGVISRYGLTMYGGNSSPKLVYLIVKNNGDAGFSYELPPQNRYDMSRPKRLSDFNGYNPEAQCPLRTTFADGWKFPYIATDYPLNGIELTEGYDTGQLYRVDIYPTEDADGNKIDMRRGIYIKSGAYTFWCVGSLNLLSDPLGTTKVLSNLAGKTFEIFEFMTNAPDGITSLSSKNDWTASGYWCYALPYPIVTCSMEPSSGGGGTTPTYEIARVVFTTYPVFQRLSSADYSTVFASFKISSRGTQYQGGKVTGIVCGIYRDATCTDPIDRTYFDDITLGAEADSQTYSARLANSTGVSGVYFGVWFNNKLQYSGVPKATVTTIHQD